MKKMLVFLLVTLGTVTYGYGQVSNMDDEYEQFLKNQRAEYEQFVRMSQAEYDAFRKQVNEEYAQFMRQAWREFKMQKALMPIQEKPVPPVVYTEPEPQPKPQPKEDVKPQPKKDEKPQPKEDVKPQPKKDEKPQPKEDEKPQPKKDEKPQPKEDVKPQPKEDIKSDPIPVKPVVVVVPEPEPEPQPIAPVEPKEDTFESVSFVYYGTATSLSFPKNDKLHIAALTESALADAWQTLSGEAYDITVKTALDAKKTNDLCDWGYMSFLRDATEKQYGKSNEAVLMQAFLMNQSGYRIRLGMANNKLYMLLASNYDIFGYNYYLIDGTKFYVVSGDKNLSMRICEAKYDKERSLSMQITRLPKLKSQQTPKRTLTSKKGLTSTVSVNKNMIDFFNGYPQACFQGDQTTRWAAYANTPMETSVKEQLYPPLKKSVEGMPDREAVGLLLNWVQTAFVYEYDDKVWGGDRAFFAQETLYYPYCDCEDRAILFSRLVRDLIGLDVVLLYYPGHLATAVAFNDEEKGDWLQYKQRKYIVCDPTYINAGVGRTMPGMDNQKAQVIALK